MNKFQIPLNIWHCMSVKNCPLLSHYVCLPNGVNIFRLHNTTIFATPIWKKLYQAIFKTPVVSNFILSIVWKCPLSNFFLSQRTYSIFLHLKFPLCSRHLKFPLCSRHLLPFSRQAFSFFFFPYHSPPAHLTTISCNNPSNIFYSHIPPSNSPPPLPPRYQTKKNIHFTMMMTAASPAPQQ